MSKIFLFDAIGELHCMPMVDCKMFTYFSEILCASRNEQIIQINGKSREGWGHEEMAHASCFAPCHYYVHL